MGASVSESKSLLVRGFTPDQLTELDNIAHARQETRQEMLYKHIVALIDGNRPVVLGWVRLDRWGELDHHAEDPAECPECGQDIDPQNAYVGLLSNGQNYGPVCRSCGSSE